MIIFENVDVKNIKVLLLFLLSLSFMPSVVAQEVPVEYAWVRYKSAFPPLSPLPPDKTYDVLLPDGMKYLSNINEVRSYWSPFGLILINKRLMNSNADYAFKMEMPGLQILTNWVESTASDKTASGREFIRQYKFNFPSKLVIRNNATNEILKTITIVSDTEEFTRTFHANFFNTNKMDPNYKTIVGFSTLEDLQKAEENNPNIFKRMEGDFAAEIFDKMKQVLVHLYGNALLRVDWPIFNPTVKGRTGDFTAFDAAYEKFKRASDMMQKTPNDLSYKPLLEEADAFYSITEKDLANHDDYIPYLVYWNLTELKLLQGDVDQANIYFDKFMTVKRPRASLKDFLIEAHQTAKDFFTARNMAK
jgi:hypothetical protein